MSIRQVKRNQKIYQLAKQGVSPYKLALRFHVTPSRVYGIIRREEQLAASPTPTKRSETQLNPAVQALVFQRAHEDVRKRIKEALDFLQAGNLIQVKALLENIYQLIKKL